MTEALYLTDSYQKECEAKITEIGETTDHQKYVILDQTIMYPMGGGQPSDKGQIAGEGGSLKIKQVDYNDGAIKHIGKLTGKMAVGDKVTVSIEWDTRYKHMQLHTAGHLVDLIVRQLSPNLIPTRGMHGIGKQLYVEYEGVHELNTAKINAALTQLVTSHTPITTHFTTLEELKKIANWLPPKLPSSKKLRVLSIGDSYHIPDGGTQLQSTDECWSIQVILVKKSDSNTQVHYQVSEPINKRVDVSIHRDTDGKSITDSIQRLENEFATELGDIEGAEKLEAIRIKYLSKANGLTTKLLSTLQGLTLQDKKIYGPQLNKLKSSQESAIEQKQHELLAVSRKLSADTDLTIPHAPRLSGRLHPTTIVIRELNDFFRSQGYSIGEGPEIETAEYNFRKLNLPEGHPATDLQGTLFIKSPDLLMRTHTSSVETRILTNNKPPLRVAVPGKVYRNETTSKTNSSFFHHYQGLVVDKGINIQHLKHTLTLVHQYLFGADVVLRYRYKYYPEVSPGMGIDMQCRFCMGKGCEVCKQRGWIESLGSGMIHYNTLKMCGIDPNVYTGFAFGMGLDRLVMNKFGIPDIRKLYGGELVYV